MPSDCMRTSWITAEELAELYPPMETISMEEYVARYGFPAGYGIVDAGFVMVRSEERESREAAELRRHLDTRYDGKGRIIGMTPRIGQ